MTTLHYTGTEPVVFMTGNVGPVEPGADFTVPDELAEAFLARADVERPAGDQADPTDNPPTGDQTDPPADPPAGNEPGPTPEPAKVRKPRRGTDQTA